MTETQSMPGNKAELLDDLHARWNAFVLYVDSLSHDQWAGPTDAAGWTVSDHVAHVTAWDRAVIELLRHRTPVRRTLQVSDAVWESGIDAINAEIRQRTMGRPVDTLKLERDATFADMAEAVSNFSDEGLERPGGEFGLDKGGKCLREILVGYPGGHYDEHRQYIATLVEAQPFRGEGSGYDPGTSATAESG